jgi:hypothetical protein
MHLLPTTIASFLPFCWGSVSRFWLFSLVISVPAYPINSPAEVYVDCTVVPVPVPVPVPAPSHLSVSPADRLCPCSIGVAASSARLDANQKHTRCDVFLPPMADTLALAPPFASDLPGRPPACSYGSSDLTAAGRSDRSSACAQTRTCCCGPEFAQTRMHAFFRETASLLYLQKMIN